VQGAPDVLRTITTSGVVQSGGGLNPFVSGVMRSLIDLGLADAVLDGLRRVYAERSAVLCRALREWLPAVTFVEPTGGYFVWAQLPMGHTAAELLPVARASGVAFHLGTRFSRSGGFAAHMRLSFAHYDAPELEEGVRRLAHAFTVSAA
jgi:DNA-binding transcriptional MocR family regulator